MKYYPKGTNGIDINTIRREFKAKAFVYDDISNFYKEPLYDSDYERIIEKQKAEIKMLKNVIKDLKKKPKTKLFKIKKVW